jgi:hypothetical protein
MMTPEDMAAFRVMFVEMLTTDSETQDRRRKEFNQSLFYPADSNWAAGRQKWSAIDLDMVLDVFDNTVKRMKREQKK